MPIVTNALTYTWKTKHQIFCKIMKNHFSTFKTCPIPHQRLNFHILQKKNTDLAKCVYIYAFSGKRVKEQRNGVCCVLIKSKKHDINRSTC